MIADGRVNFPRLGAKTVILRQKAVQRAVDQRWRELVGRWCGVKVVTKRNHTEKSKAILIKSKYKQVAVVSRRVGCLVFDMKDWKVLQWRRPLRKL
jgi:hypothetical protein